MPLFSHPFHKIIHTLRQGYNRYFGNILSGRGYILMGFVIYLFLGPVSFDTDIVSSYIAYGLFGTLVAALIISIGFGAYLRGSLKATLYLPDGELTSGTEQIVVLKTSRIRVPALFLLDVEFLLDQPGAELPVFRVTGSGLSERNITATTKFPHRGVWKVDSVRFSFGDQAGICRFRWTVPQDAQVSVSPPTVWNGVLPVMSSSQRPGDAVTDVNNRHGDHFDIKQYHPTDGVRKILWKVFAKRGELLSRHPEPSMTPEGQVILFALAERIEDEVCTRFLTYIDQLEELNLTLVIGCQGMGHRDSVSDKESAQNLVIETAWQSSLNTVTETQDEVLRLVSACKLRNPDIRIDRVILFASPSNPRLAELSAALGEALERDSIAPVFFLSAGEPQTLEKQSLLNKVLMTPRVAKGTDPEIYAAFLQTCLVRSWEVVL